MINGHPSNLPNEKSMALENDPIKEIVVVGIVQRGGVHAALVAVKLDLPVKIRLGWRGPAPRIFCIVLVEILGESVVAQVHLNHVAVRITEY